MGLAGGDGVGGSRGVGFTFNGGQAGVVFIDTSYTHLLTPCVTARGAPESRHVHADTEIAHYRDSVHRSAYVWHGAGRVERCSAATPRGIHCCTDSYPPHDLELLAGQD